MCGVLEVIGKYAPLFCLDKDNPLGVKHVSVSVETV